ncbi:MAG: hypothetical protein U5M51_07360 [Emticicia sp.]|nr:hypothetical protein [Emticicia sp.]
MKKSIYLLLAGAMFFTACKETTMEEMPKSLYVRLGGNGAISAVIDQFIANVAADTRINAFFADAASDPARLTKLRNNLINQIGEATSLGDDAKILHIGGEELHLIRHLPALHRPVGCLDKAELVHLPVGRQEAMSPMLGSPGVSMGQIRP